MNNEDRISEILQKYKELEIDSEALSVNLTISWALSIAVLILLIVSFFIKIIFNRMIVGAVLVFAVVFLVNTYTAIEIKEKEKFEIRQEIELIIKEIPKVVTSVEGYSIVEDRLVPKSEFIEEAKTSSVKMLFKKKNGGTVERKMEVKINKKEDAQNLELKYIPLGKNLGPYKAGIYEPELIVPK